ncbi:very short patch repair endonuclease [Polaromonas sp. YR568]|uniref:very short patch repair endonuclease n=1 Tax=Polaromonas sp. YR568 TaxID=1855301 RepID=UPI000B835BCA|nr:very short patch repair endonuclease [Polaromonas sp. YR568]
MTDVVSPQTRSAMMSGIKGKNTKPELIIRKALFAAGYRFRLHRKDLPGRPDIVLPKRRIAIFVHGCFWHLHQNCSLSKLPATRADFWKKKLEGNVYRDEQAIYALQKMGWRVLTVWECFIRPSQSIESLTTSLTSWIDGVESIGVLGKEQRV